MRLYDPIGGEHMNIMKAGIQNSHRVVAVSGACAAAQHVGLGSQPPAAPDRARGGGGASRAASGVAKQWSQPGHHLPTRQRVCDVWG
jgi:hypothetical protein